MDVIKFSLGLSFLIFAWFYTEVLLDYAKLLKVERYFGYDKWLVFVRSQNDPYYSKYPIFLRETYPCWATKLLGCSICLAGFLNITIGGLCWLFYGYPFLNILFGAFVTLSGYYILEILLNFVNKLSK